MAKRNRITATMSKTIAESSPLIKKTKSNNTSEVEKVQALEVTLKDLIANPYQPRMDMNVQALNELISSIEQNGLLQPIVITNKNDYGKYTIVAGHRRVEAHKIMGKHSIKATIIEDVAEKELAILSLTENLLRENLHPLENAIAVKSILDSGLVESQNKLAEYIGLSKGYISKLINALKLPESILQKVKSDNYVDIDILALLNKLPDEAVITEAYGLIKKLSRSEAEKLIKSRYLNQPVKSQGPIEIKSTSSKINININTKKLTPAKLKVINEKIEQLNVELSKIIEE
jgi:ParB family chromosome partitioning protein